MSSKKRKHTKKAKVPESGRAESMASKPKTDSSFPRQRQWSMPSATQDDLQRIKGIGLTTAIALNNVGITRYRHFKDTSAEEIAELLQNEQGISISAEEILQNKWFEQASELHEEYAETTEYELEHVPAEAMAASAEESGSPKPAENADSERTQKISAGSAKPSLQKTASKKVSSKPDDVKTGSSATEAAAPKKVVPAAARSKSEETAEKDLTSRAFLPATTSQEKTKPQLQIQEVEFAQINQDPDSDNSLLVALLKLSGNHVDGNSMISGHVQIHAENRNSGAHEIIASSTINLAQLPNEVKLKCRPLQVGVYKLRVVAFPSVDEAIVAWYDGPTLRIVL